MDGNEIKRMLNERAEGVCEYLLPAGKRDKMEWVIGDVTGTPGQSLRVHLAGAKQGWWADFAQPDQYRGRNLLSLWMAVRSVDFVTAIKEASDFLGIKEDRGWRRTTSGSVLKPLTQKKEAAAPVDLTKEYVPLRPGGQVFKWLTETRKIPEDVLKQYRVGESTDGKCVVFPSWTADGKLNSLKFRNITDKSRIWVAPGGAPKMLFGLQAIPAQQEDIFITEGEIDAMTMATYGWPAVSVPFGAKWPSAAPSVAGAAMDGRQGAMEGRPGSAWKDPNTEWIQHDYEWLERFIEVYLCLDADEPGQKATAALVKRFGAYRCRILEYPKGKKDANECLVAGIDEQEFWKIKNAARDLDPEKLLKPSDIEQEIWFEFFPELDTKKRLGEPTPWDALSFTFNPSELTIWHGYNGNGKTVLLNHMMLVWATYGASSCVASLEFPSRKTFKNIARQAMGKSKPKDEAELSQTIQWMDEHFWLYAHIGVTTLDDVLDIFTYAARKYGVRHFVLDSLMMLTDIGSEDYDAQKMVVLRLKSFAVDYGVHVHLVAHSKKPDSKHDPDKYPPRKYDISGSGNISNIADNVICVWRNREKELKLEAASDLARAGLKKDADEIFALYQGKEDARFIIQKNRETGEEITRRLFFDKGDAGSWQYFDEKTREAGPVRYVGKTKVE